MKKAERRPIGGGICLDCLKKLMCRLSKIKLSLKMDSFAFIVNRN